jgi:dethiobiotin synthetase
MRATGLFIAGTDTGVGKTVVTGLIGSMLIRRGIRPGVMKPVATGCARRGGALCSPDALFLKEMLGLDDPLDLINPVRFPEPVAPAVAASLAGGEVDLAACDGAYRELRSRHDLVLVEGIGGLHVPLKETFTVADLALRWGLPLLIVARPGLGTINHTVLTVRCAQAQGIPVAGFIFDESTPAAGDASVETNASAVEKLCRTPFWGTISYGGKLMGDYSAWRALCDAAEHAVGRMIDDFLVSRRGR